MAATATLDFVTFYVSDLTKSLAYFTDVLGFTHVPEESAPGFQFMTGDGGISFGLMLAGAQTPAAGTHALYVKVADIHAQRAAVMAKGVEASPIEQRPFGAISTVHTPDGTPLILFEPPAAS